MTQSKTPPSDGVYQEKVKIDPLRLFDNPTLLNSAVTAAVNAIESRMRDNRFYRDDTVAPDITIFVTIRGKKMPHERGSECVCGAPIHSAECRSRGHLRGPQVKTA